MENYFPWGRGGVGCAESGSPWNGLSAKKKKVADKFLLLFFYFFLFLHLSHFHGLVQHSLVEEKLQLLMHDDMKNYIREWGPEGYFYGKSESRWNAFYVALTRFKRSRKRIAFSEFSATLFPQGKLTKGNFLPIRKILYHVARVLFC